MASCGICMHACSDCLSHPPLHHSLFGMSRDTAATCCIMHHLQALDHASLKLAAAFTRIAVSSFYLPLLQVKVVHLCRHATMGQAQALWQLPPSGQVARFPQ